MLVDFTNIKSTSLGTNRVRAGNVRDFPTSPMLKVLVQASEAIRESFAYTESLDIQEKSKSYNAITDDNCDSKQGITIGNISVMQR